MFYNLSMQVYARLNPINYLTGVLVTKTVKVTIIYTVAYN